MPSINPYLNFPGTTEEAFNFYRSVFGGEFLGVQRFRDTPDAGNMPPEVLDQIMHISLPIGKANVLMATDAPESLGFKLTAGNNSYVCISPDSEEEATKLFDGLSVGGTIGMPLQKMFWGSIYGDLTDRFGIKWMVNFDLNQNKMQG